MGRGSLDGVGESRLSKNDQADHRPLLLVALAHQIAAALARLFDAETAYWSSKFLLICRTNRSPIHYPGHSVDPPGLHPLLSSCSLCGDPG